MVYSRNSRNCWSFTSRMKLSRGSLQARLLSCCVLVVVGLEMAVVAVGDVVAVVVVVGAGRGGGRLAKSC